MGGRWDVRAVRQCEAQTKHTEGTLKGKPSGERCKRAALEGHRFCRLHNKEHATLCLTN